MTALNLVNVRRAISLLTDTIGKIYKDCEGHQTKTMQSVNYFLRDWLYKGVLYKVTTTYVSKYQTELIVEFPDQERFTIDLTFTPKTSYQEMPSALAESLGY